MSQLALVTAASAGLVLCVFDLATRDLARRVV